MLLGQLDVSQLHVGKGHSVNRLRVLGLNIKRAAQIVESPQAVAFLAEDGTQVLEGYRILESASSRRTAGTRATRRVMPTRKTERAVVPAKIFLGWMAMELFMAHHRPNAALYKE